MSPSVVRATPMDFVVTVPAIWSNAAKEATERAAAVAGFCGNSRIQLISEPVCAVRMSGDGERADENRKLLPCIL